MTPRTKSILLLGGTILIGMLLGALINGMVMRQRLEQIGELGTPSGLFFVLEDAVRLEDEAQRRAIRAVLEEAAARAMDIREHSRREMHNLRDSIRAELVPLLSEDQLERLEARLNLQGQRPFFRRFPPTMRDALRERWRRRRGGPPPFRRRRPGIGDSTRSDTTR
ncbi:MAG: hypothetical protein ACE5G0_16000 [Rhodothermales bacterium]